MGVKGVWVHGYMGVWVYECMGVKGVCVYVYGRVVCRCVDV